MRPQSDNNSNAAAATRALVQALDNAAAFGHAISGLQRIETHISWIILTGEFAYKIKKPVDFGFLDYSTLALRRACCEEELRLNYRFAPQIYLRVVAIRGSLSSPRLHGDGRVIEYAVQMREFPQQSLFSYHATAATLRADMVDAIALRVAGLHRDAPVAAANSDFGSPRSVQHWSEENLAQLRNNVPAERMPASFDRLCQWYDEITGLPERLRLRQQHGCIRECHGDLHLGNMALLDGEVVPFDCIEFNPELRWIDSISEAAFVAMDLQARGYPHFCWRFISGYLESSADYAGVDLLRYYFVYRALVRAKVEALRLQAAASTEHEDYAGLRNYLDLAAQWAGSQNAGLILMHGLSGSGKSTVAAALVEILGAIRLRSDVVRKRMFELEIDADSESAPGAGIYSADATTQTYRRLREYAADILAAGFLVIVDATFLSRSQRQVLLELASAQGCAAVVVDCNAPLDELRRRIRERENDPSEANLQVLERQLEQQQPVDPAEAGITGIVRVGSGGLGDDHTQRIRELLLAEPVTVARPE